MITLWQKPNEKVKKSIWHEFTAFVSRRTTSGGRGALGERGLPMGRLLYSCIPGHNVMLADAIQAYIQARLTGPPCWVELPEDAWPDDIDFRKFRRPVVRLVKALDGRPDAGTMWEQHGDTSSRSWVHASGRRMGPQCIFTVSKIYCWLFLSKI